MLEEKKVQLKQYHELSMRLLDTLLQGSVDDVPGLIEQREVCISAINKLDETAGTLLMNKQIQEQLTELMNLELEIKKHLQQSLQRLANRVRLAQNEQYITKRYDEQMPVSKGVFYDKKK